MTRAGLLMLAIVAVLGGAVESRAQFVVYTQAVQGQDGPISDGEDGYFWGVRTSDNFMLSDPSLREITEVTWWGSSEYVGFAHLENFDAWVIKIYSDFAGEPDQLLYNGTFAKADTNPAQTGDRNSLGGWEYQHHVTLSNPITLYVDEPYWISIGALLVDSGADEWIWSINYTDGDGFSLQDSFDGAGYSTYPDDAAFVLWGDAASGGCPRPGCELGDANGDCLVNLSDLGLLLASYGLCEGDPGYNPAADFNGDGCVDLSDLGALLAYYGADCNY